jgi:serine/threonine-protein kinase
MKYRVTSDEKWLKQAEASGKRAAELDNRLPATHVAIGQVNDLSGHHDLAASEFQRAIDLDPRDAEAIGGLAKAYKKAGNNPEAERAYIKAAALRPNDWKGYNDLGLFYWSTNRPKEAIAQFNRALALTPDNSWPYINLGLAYMDLDDPKMLEEAERAFKKSIALNPTFAAYSNLGSLYEEQHQFPKSVAANEAALKLNANSADVWGNLANAYEWLGGYQKAQAARRKAVELLEEEVRLDQPSAGTEANLAALYAKQGERDKSLDCIRSSLALAPTKPSEHIESSVLSDLADAYELLGQRKEAIRYLQEALANGLGSIKAAADPEIQGVLSDPNFRTANK